MEALVNFTDTTGRKRKGIRINCLQCDVSFVSRKDSRRKCCSIKCSGEYRRNAVITNCATCNKEITKKPSQIKYSKSGLNFCSNQCKNKAQTIDVGIIPLAHFRGGRTVYRKRALLEYGAKCVKCGYDEYEEGLQVHHIDKDRDNNVLENLIVLCGTCHLLTHNGII